MHETHANELPATSYAVLGLLSLADELSGYDLKQWAENLRFFYWSPAQSQIYAELRRLSALGLVAERDVEQVGRPDKRLYRITERGLAEVRRWLEETPVEPPVLKHSVALRVFFGHLARPERLRAVVEAYARRAQALRAELEALRAELGDDPRWTYPALVAEWGLHYYAAEVAAAQQLAQRLPGTDSTPPDAG